MPEICRRFPHKIGGFQENRLIRGVREKERELRKKHHVERLPRPVSLDMKVDRWFLTRFSIDNAYLGLCQEFHSLEGAKSAWDMRNLKANPFISIQMGGATERQLKVNAHRIGSTSHPEYIASEGPTIHSVYDFWSMVWQENVSRIVSVNFPHEERLYPSVFDRNKETVQYWPIVPGQTDLYMPFRVTCLETRMMISTGIRALTPNEMVYRVTRLSISFSNPMREECEMREVFHLCFYRWPDGRIPIPWPLKGSHIAASVLLTDALRREFPPTAGPLLVHCHAGIGRTGVFISIDMALRQLETTRTVNIKGVVEQLREKRPKAVMNPWQYAMINVVLAEKALYCGALSPFVGGHCVRQLVDKMWRTIVLEVDHQFKGSLVTYSTSLLSSPRPFITSF